jgi:hypothetical protein
LRLAGRDRRIDLQASLPRGVWRRLAPYRIAGRRDDNDVERRVFRPARQENRGRRVAAVYDVDTAATNTESPP